MRPGWSYPVPGQNLALFGAYSPDKKCSTRRYVFYNKKMFSATAMASEDGVASPNGFTGAVTHWCRGSYVFFVGWKNVWTVQLAFCQVFGQSDEILCATQLVAFGLI